MGKDSIVLEIFNELVASIGEIKSKVNSLYEQSEHKIQTPCRINEMMSSSGDEMSEDSEHDAALTSGGQESSTYSQKHDKKGTYNALTEKWNGFRDSKRWRFEENLRSALESNNQQAFILMYVSSNLIQAHYHICQSLTEINPIHFEKKQTGYKPSGNHTAKKYLLRVCGNIAGRRHELRHILQKFFYLDVYHFQSSQPKLPELDLAYESKLDKLWRDLEATLPFRTLRNYFEERVSGDRLTEEEEMRHEGLRLRSFHGVNMNVSYLRLAAAGFYATKNGDETKCFSCGIRHRNWERGDNPFVVHTHHSPKCKHLNSTDVKNVPIQLPKSSVTQPTTDRTHQSTQQSQLSENAGQDDVQGATGTTRNRTDAYGIPQSFPAQLSALSARDDDEVAPALSFDGSVHPHYSSTASRLESFKLWSDGHSQRPEELVRAGFFYAGYADCVRCFVCGVGLRTWEEGDDPWTEHIRWRPSCAYVEAVRGKRFIMQTLAALGRSQQATSKTDRNQQAPSSNNMNRNKEGEGILRNAVCAQAVEMGFSRDKVEAAARATANPAGKSSLTLDVPLETILVTDGEVSEQTEADLPMDREVPGRAQANIGSCSFDTTQEVSRIIETMLDNEEERRRSPDPQRKQALQRLPEDENTSSDNTSAGTGLTVSSLVTKKEEEDKDSLTSNLPSKEFIVTGRRTSSRTNVFYNDNDLPQPGVVSSVDTTSSLGDNNDGRNGGDRRMGEAVLSMPTERQRPEKIDKIKNKSQHKGMSKEDLKATAEESRQLKESSACKICLEDPANIVFLPCGHLVACAVCSPALERCPVCRQHIRGTIRAHMASRKKYIANF